MEWQVILILVLVIPLLLIPALLIWYINIGGIYAAIKEVRERRAARVEKNTAVAEAKQHATVVAPKK